jgi:hypothetical protein
MPYWRIENWLFFSDLSKQPCPRSKLSAVWSEGEYYATHGYGYTRVSHSWRRTSVSFCVWKALETAWDAHRCVSHVYRGQNKYDGTWSLALLNENPSFTQYQEQIQHILADVQAQPLLVPPESLTPLVKQFLAAQAEMRLAKTSFLEKHHPRQKPARRPKKRKR